MPAPSPLPETSTTATSSRSPWRAVTTKSPANSVPPAERSSLSTYQSSGSSGMPPWRRMRSRRSTSIDSPWSPATPSRDRRKLDNKMTKPSAKRMTTVTAVRLSISGCWGTSTASINKVSTTNQGSWRGPSRRLATTSGTTMAVRGM